jgi:ribosomal protein S18 acetylase RimI-like enzyme
VSCFLITVAPECILHLTPFIGINRVCCALVVRYFPFSLRCRALSFLVPQLVHEHNSLEQETYRHRANQTQLEYRLRTCGELCSGLFSSAYPTTSGPLGETIKLRSFPSIDSTDADRKRVIIGHVISTKSNSPLVTDDAMDYPKDWRTNYQLTPNIGHNEDGQTICLHSLCVHPNFARKGLGSILLQSYVQRIKDSGVGSRIALICRERYIQFYEKAGFKKIGPSKCQYGGGNWVDMVLDFEDSGDDGWEY